jgi:hypothetical protein
MSRAIGARLARLEATSGPRALGHLHIIYARDGADYEAQRTVLLADGRAKATDTFMDWNYGLGLDQRDVRQPETIRITETHDERVKRWAKEGKLNEQNHSYPG